MESIKTKHIKISENLDEYVRCYCGNKANRRYSVKNQREYFSCEFYFNEPKKACKFFQWVDIEQLRLEAFGIINNDIDISMMSLSSSLPSPSLPLSLSSFSNFNKNNNNNNINNSNNNISNNNINIDSIEEVKKH
ncbi:17025_t:CDS:2 [Entrophospora sp. SA101]|nr:17025_t:CDS:2 [Entrophospora sp. SA101]